MVVVAIDSYAARDKICISTPYLDTLARAIARDHVFQVKQVLYSNYCGKVHMLLSVKRKAG